MNVCDCVGASKRTEGKASVLTSCQGSNTAQGGECECFLEIILKG